MALQVLNDGAKYVGKFINIDFIRLSDSGKTHIYHVIAENGDILGKVEWMARWRKYWFAPSGDASINYFVGFEENCLRDIADFLELLTKRHKENRRLGLPTRPPKVTK